MVKNELYHHGVKGMKWGHRKALPTSSTYNKVKNAQSAYKDARKIANKKYNIMYDRAANHPIATNFTKKGRAKYEKAFDEYYDAEKNRQSARDAYNAAKKERKTQLKNTTKELNKKASFGEKMMYNDATRKKAAKYIVDNNMSVSEATNKAKGEALRNSALLVTAVGAYTVASLYAAKR